MSYICIGVADWRGAGAKALGVRGGTRIGGDRCRAIRAVGAPQRPNSLDLAIGRHQLCWKSDAALMGHARK